MYFVKKSDIKDKIPLPSYEKNILEKPEDFSQEQRRELAQRLLEFRDTHWISCDCDGQEPIVVICKRSNGDIYLRRRTKTGHTSECIFNHSDIEIYSNSPTSFIPSKKITTFCLYHNSQKLLGCSDENKNQKHIRNVSRLGQLLYTILCESQLNVVTFETGKVFGKDLLHVQYESLRAVFKQKKISKDISLEPFFHYTLTEKSLKFAESKLLNPSRVINKPWPSYIKPFILFLNRSFEITSNTFSHPSMGHIPVSSQIKTTSTWIDKKKSAPYLVLSSLILDEGNAFTFQDAFAIPILSDSIFMPLESSFERTVLKIILGVVSSFSEKERVKIEKPLFCYKTPDLQMYRPDFVIYGKGDAKIFIEVLGSKNEEYLSHKALLNKIASNHCTRFISVKGYNLNQEYAPFKEKLIAALNDIIS